MLIDYHMHTRLTDGTQEPVDYARIAVERGLDEIGCSDHAPLADRETDWTMKKADLDTYVGWVMASSGAKTGRPGMKCSWELKPPRPCSGPCEAVTTKQAPFSLVNDHAVR